MVGPVSYGILLGGYAFTIGIAEGIFDANPGFCIRAVDMVASIQTPHHHLYTHNGTQALASLTIDLSDSQVALHCLY